MSIDIADAAVASEFQGRQAFLAGIAILSNPYRARYEGASTGERDLRQAWIRGWLSQGEIQASAADARALRDHRAAQAWIA